MSLPQSFYNLRLEMANIGLSPRGLAKHLKITDQTIYKKLGGISEFKLNEIEAVMQFFNGRDIGYIFNRTDEDDK